MIKKKSSCTLLRDALILYLFANILSENLHYCFLYFIYVPTFLTYSEFGKKKIIIPLLFSFQNKITKRLWVLHECCERVPESLKAAKELIEFGLQATNIRAVLNEDTSSSKYLWK